MGDCLYLGDIRLIFGQVRWLPLAHRGKKIEAGCNNLTWYMSDLISAKARIGMPQIAGGRQAAAAAAAAAAAVAAGGRQEAAAAAAAGRRI